MSTNQSLFADLGLYSRPKPNPSPPPPFLPLFLLRVLEAWYRRCRNYGPSVKSQDLSQFSLFTGTLSKQTLRGVRNGIIKTKTKTKKAKKTKKKKKRLTAAFQIIYGPVCKK